MKYVLVTGGVVSGLGKGVTASSIGVVLKACGLRVTSIKIGLFSSSLISWMPTIFRFLIPSLTSLYPSNTIMLITLETHYYSIILSACSFSLLNFLHKWFLFSFLLLVLNKLAVIFNDHYLMVSVFRLG